MASPAGEVREGGSLGPLAVVVGYLASLMAGFGCPSLVRRGQQGLMVTVSSFDAAEVLLGVIVTIAVHSGAQLNNLPSVRTGSDTFSFSLEISVLCR